MNLKCIPLLATLFFSTFSNAQEILTVTRDDMPVRLYKIHTVLNNEGDLEKIRLVVTEPQEVKTDKGEEIKTVTILNKSFTIAELTAERGAVIDSVDYPGFDERIATSLKASSEFNGKDGGTATFKYLTNFRRNSHGSIELKLARNGQSWAVYLATNNQLVKSIQFKIAGFLSERGAKSYKTE